jgi:NADPH:quinone reductase-like Zn-dependent oxidoreductase
MKVQLLFRVLMRLYIGLRKPKRRKILSLKLVDMIESLGKNVKSFKQGDEVFGTPGLMHSGTYTEYICLPENSNKSLLQKKPTNMTFETAPFPMGGLEAFQYLGKGRVKSGYKVLINGAGGTVGTFAVQLAK